MSEIVAFRNRCEDNDLANDLPRLETVRLRTQILNGTTCADFVAKCGSLRSGEIVRLLCPRSCNCGMPRSGLYTDGPTFGCARTVCRNSEEAQAALSSLE